MKSLLIPTLLLAAIPLAKANQIAESQLKYIEKYKDQTVVPKPEAMLLNTEPEPELSEGFTPLYNGKDLNGWIPLGGHCSFEASGETIVGTCIQGSPSTYLSTVKSDYTDFIFTAELKWAVDSNSGIMFRALKKENNKGVMVYGPQAEMEGFKDYPDCRGWSGGIYGQSCGGWYYPLWLDAHSEARKALKKDGWNRITIEAKGDTVKTWINGIPAAHWKNNEYPKGFFALQVHQGQQGTILFRNIKVKEL